MAGLCHHSGCRYGKPLELAGKWSDGKSIARHEAVTRKYLTVSAFSEHRHRLVHPAHFSAGRFSIFRLQYASLYIYFVWARGYPYFARAQRAECTRLAQRELRSLQSSRTGRTSRRHVNPWVLKSSRCEKRVSCVSEISHSSENDDRKAAGASSLRRKGISLALSFCRSPPLSLFLLISLSSCESLSISLFAVRVRSSAGNGCLDWLPFGVLPSVDRYREKLPQKKPGISREKREK